MTKENDTAPTKLASPKPVDLSSLDLEGSAAKGAELELLHPITDEPLGIFITVMGARSNAFKRAIDRLNAEQLDTRRPQSKRKVTIEAVEARSSQALAAVTIAWRNVVFEGEALDCNPKNAEMLYSQRPWIREQVDEFVGDAKNFWTGSDKS